MRFRHIVLAAALFASGAAAHAQTTPTADFPSAARDAATLVPIPNAAGGAGTSAFPGLPPSIPFVDLTLRTPQGGQEVAFSLQLLLLLTVISLAPSLPPTG